MRSVGVPPPHAATGCSSAVTTAAGEQRCHWTGPVAVIGRSGRWRGRGGGPRGCGGSRRGRCPGVWPCTGRRMRRRGRRWRGVLGEGGTELGDVLAPAACNRTGRRAARVAVPFGSVLGAFFITVGQDFDGGTGRGRSGISCGGWSSAILLFMRGVGVAARTATSELEAGRRENGGWWRHPQRPGQLCGVRAGGRQGANRGSGDATARKGRHEIPRGSRRVTPGSHCTLFVCGWSLPEE